MNSLKKQQGMTFIGWLIILFMVGIFVAVGIKITPVYLENFAIKKSLASLKEEPLISRKPLPEIRKMLMRRLDMNNIYDLTKDELTITRSGGVTTIVIKYEERRGIIANISLVMSFEDSVELISN